MGKSICAPIKEHMKRYSTPLLIQFSSVQSLSGVWLFATSWTATHQASLSIINSQSLFKHMPIESVMPPNKPILFSSHLQSFPASGSFPMSQFFVPGGQSIDVQLQHLSTFRWIFRIDFFCSWLIWSPWSPSDSQESSPTPQFQKHQFFSAQPSSQSNSHIHTWPLEKP